MNDQSTTAAGCFFDARRQRNELAQPGPGPDTGQFISAVGRDEPFAWSREYHQQTKNLLVSYSPKKLGFF